MPYRPDLEARELAWRNAEQNGARASRPLVTDPLEARRRRVAELDPFGLDEDDPPASPWIDVTVHLVFDDTGLLEALRIATVTAEQLRESLGYRISAPLTAGTVTITPTIASP